LFFTPFSFFEGGERGGEEGEGEGKKREVGEEEGSMTRSERPSAADSSYSGGKEERKRGEK